MSPKNVTFALERGVATLTLNRPDRLNSFTVAMHTDLLDVIAQLAAPDSEARVLLITGAGRGFCAGQDLSEDAAQPGPDAGDRLSQVIDRYYNRVVRGLRALPQPIVVAVNGVAAGAGSSFALVGDIVLAARSASFVQAFVKIGATPDTGGSWFLPRRVGEARARALMLLGDKLSADQAAEWGLIWKAVEDDRLLAEAMAVARRLADGPAVAQRLIKTMLDAQATNSLDEQLDLERDCQRIAAASADFSEAVEAFAAKRPPKFQGR
ncbi:MAG: 2-(1,2-epoxy-1,2-dihydrophenyl)acetyl-CoA isomerase [Rhodospirillales bacterium]|nr:2-(1,2-epoxy-1,2-dihydrophenyl)acetyl-CoA isomerase [Rhodospirillales bacterium]